MCIKQMKEFVLTGIINDFIAVSINIFHEAPPLKYMKNLQYDDCHKDQNKGNHCIGRLPNFEIAYV